MQIHATDVHSVYFVFIPGESESKVEVSVIDNILCEGYPHEFCITFMNVN